MQKVEGATAFDGSASNKLVDTNRKLFIDVEATATVTVSLESLMQRTVTIIGDGGMEIAEASSSLNAITLAQEERIIIARRAQVSALVVPTTGPLPVTFPITEQGDTASYVLESGFYSLSISGGTLDVRASQSGSAVVAEPESFALLILGLGGLVMVRRRR
ncbi:MAG: PEP-CTERM sorting domain-containing protein [Pseudomonadota bacterium]